MNPAQFARTLVTSLLHSIPHPHSTHDTDEDDASSVDDNGPPSSWHLTLAWLYLLSAWARALGRPSPSIPPSLEATDLALIAHTALSGWDPKQPAVVVSTLSHLLHSLAQFLPPSHPNAPASSAPSAPSRRHLSRSSSLSSSSSSSMHRKKSSNPLSRMRAEVGAFNDRLCLARVTSSKTLLANDAFLVGAQLTLIESQGFGSIQRTEWHWYMSQYGRLAGSRVAIHRAWPLVRRAPGLASALSRYEALVSWARALVLAPQFLNAQLLRLVWLVQVAKSCVDLRNHNSAAALVTGLLSPQVRACKALWRHVPRATGLLLSDMYNSLLLDSTSGSPLRATTEYLATTSSTWAALDDLAYELDVPSPSLGPVRRGFRLLTRVWSKKGGGFPLIPVIPRVLSALVRSIPCLSCLTELPHTAGAVLPSLVATLDAFDPISSATSSLHRLSRSHLGYAVLSRALSVHQVYGQFPLPSPTLLKLLARDVWDPFGPATCLSPHDGVRSSSSSTAEVARELLQMATSLASPLHPLHDLGVELGQRVPLPASGFEQAPDSDTIRVWEASLVSAHPLCPARATSSSALGRLLLGAVHPSAVDQGSGGAWSGVPLLEPHTRVWGHLAVHSSHGIFFLGLSRTGGRTEESIPWESVGTMALSIGGRALTIHTRMGRTHTFTHVSPSPEALLVILQNQMEAFRAASETKALSQTLDAHNVSAPAPSAVKTVPSRRSSPSFLRLSRDSPPVRLSTDDSSERVSTRAASDSILIFSEDSHTTGWDPLSFSSSDDNGPYMFASDGEDSGASADYGALMEEDDPELAPARRRRALPAPPKIAAASRVSQEELAKEFLEESEGVPLESGIALQEVDSNRGVVLFSFDTLKPGRAYTSLNTGLRISRSGEGSIRIGSRVFSIPVTQSLSPSVALASPSALAARRASRLVRLAHIKHALSIQSDKETARAVHARIAYERAQAHIRAKEARASARARADFERERRSAFKTRRLAVHASRARKAAKEGKPFPPPLPPGGPLPPSSSSSGGRKRPQPPLPSSAQEQLLEQQRRRP